MISIGTGTYGHPEILYPLEKYKVIIGKYCSIADNCKIILGGEHRSDWITTYPFNVLIKEFENIKGHPASKGDVIIENDVWIGYNVTIMSGSHICSGAIIGANSVVSGKIRPYEIRAGNPAKYIKSRFDYKTIIKLLEISWWDWSEEKIKKFIPLLLNNNIDNFIKEALK